MKIKTKSFFFSFLILFTLTTISLFPSLGLAEEIFNPTVSVDILAVQIGTFQDDTPGDGSGKLSSSCGGFDFLSFENKGIFSSNPETGEIVVYGKGRFRIELNFWTGCVYSNIYPNINIERIRAVPYFHLGYWKLGPTGLFNIEKYSDEYACIRFRDIDVGNIYNRHNYDGKIPITIGIDPGLKFGGGMAISGQNFTVPSLISDIISVENTLVRSGDVGTYKDEYTESEFGLKSTTVELMVTSDVVFESTKEIVDWMNAEKPGLKGVSNITHDPCATVQQSIIDESNIGTITPYGSHEQFTFDLPIHIQPEVWKTRQRIDYKFGSINYLLFVGYIIDAVIKEEIEERLVSIHVQNVFVHYEFEINTDLFMTCNFEGKLSESFLHDPNLIISNQIWDTTLFGDKAYKVPLTALPPMWGWLIIFLIILFVLIGIFIAYRIYKVRSQRKFYLKLAGRK